MVYRKQHIVAAPHLVVISMYVWLLYDLIGFEPKQLLLFLCFEQLFDIHKLLVLSQEVYFQCWYSSYSMSFAIYPGYIYWLVIWNWKMESKKFDLM